MNRIGSLDYRVAFDLRKKAADDGYGNTLYDWDTIWRCWAAFRPDFGREQLEAGRLESTSRGVMTIRSCKEARTITPEYQVRFISGPYDGKTYQIRSIIPVPDFSAIEFTLEEGVAN